MPNKYHAKKQYYKGMRFDSKKEFQRLRIDYKFPMMQNNAVIFKGREK